MAARDTSYVSRNGVRNSGYYPQRSAVEQPHAEEENVVVQEPIDCTPAMCVHPAALFHWFEWILFFILHFLVQVTCDADTCTMILNEFGYKAMGQIYVLIVDFVLWCVVSVIIIGYAMNMHRSLPGAILAIEKLYAIIGIIAMVIAGGVGIYCAIQANDPEINFMGRGLTHIQPQWIAAACLEFIIAIVLLLNLLLQRREGYPFSVTLPKRAPKKAPSDSTHALTTSAYNDFDANPYKPTSQPAPQFNSQFNQFAQEPGMRRPMGRQEHFY
ncbi:hypothetical protein QR680_014012 [Steinernema hermaphroditum]|uniref:MARVEL domain-containing protein n=1 Tax=Steinernema hermaphroditum TaxID=289476 RepID=A0AA39I9Q0_9BILA|nr:hypothetical protein QR680_014012 [Steinernema hermaphroditum]